MQYSISVLSQEDDASISDLALPRRRARENFKDGSQLKIHALLMGNDMFSLMPPASLITRLFYREKCNLESVSTPLEDAPLPGAPLTVFENYSKRYHFTILRFFERVSWRIDKSKIE